MSSSLSNYALRMARLSARIFGEVARPTNTKSMKVVKLFSELPMAKQKEVYDWYPPHRVYVSLMRTLRFYGLYSLSNYALRMACLSARIFGEVARMTNTKSMKVVKLFSELPMAKQKEVYDWYPPHRVYVTSSD